MTIVIILVVLVIVGALGYGIYKYAIVPMFTKPISASSPIPAQVNTNVSALNAAISNAGSSLKNCSGSSGSSGSKEGFQSKPLGSTCAALDTLFLNTQPLSIKDTGFLGPYPNGIFNEEAATSNALKAGFRFLTLQIDYLDTKKDLSNFEAPGLPTLLVRNASGAIVGGNSGSIKTVANSIANNGFSPAVPNNTLPIVIYLHINRAPSAVTDAEGYLTFLSKIASALSSLGPYHLGSNPLGNFTRQKLADQILTMSLKSLEGQVIIMSNADTSLFRNTAVTKGAYAPADDLDFWVNIRVTLDTEADTNGITQLADASTASSAVLVSLSRVVQLSALNQNLFAGKGKKRYVIAMGSRTENPTPGDVDIALEKLGVNAVPFDIFTPESKDILILANEYSDMTYKPKPAALQYV